MKKTLIALSLAASLMAGSAMATPVQKVVTTQITDQVKKVAKTNAGVARVQKSFVLLNNAGVDYFVFTSSASATTFLETYLGLTSSDIVQYQLITTVTANKDYHVGLSALVPFVS